MLAATLVVLITTPSTLPFRCGTPALLERGERPSLVAPTHRLLDVGKDDRDAYGDFAHREVSDNFVLKWGANFDLPEGRGAEVLAAFEHTWEVEIGGMGFPPPEHSDEFLFNVYIGNSGDPSPEIHDALGYFWYDPAGYPQIVLDPSAVNGFGADTAAVVAHEFMHALQAATGSYSTIGGFGHSGAWYWEACASWVPPLVVEGTTDNAMYLAGYGGSPHLPLDYFSAASDDLTAVHQYGAFIFAQYLSEYVGGPELVRDSWLLAGEETDPLVVVDGLLAERGSSLAPVFIDFAAHNATWDYEARETYVTWNDLLLGYYPENDHQYAATFVRQGDGELHRISDELAPQGYGYNVIQLLSPRRGALELELVGDAIGSRGTPASFEAMVVREHPTGIDYVPLELEKRQGTMTLDIDDDSAVYLVVAAPVADARTRETFGYRYRIGEAASDDEGGCAAVTPDLLPLVALAVLGLRRRRRPSSDSLVTKGQ
jgi:hypothetical protein